MALVLANRVQETATPNTTVSFTLTGAVSGFQTFAVIGNTNTTYYSATDSSGNWEVGEGTYSTTGPTLTRTTVYASSNSGSAVTFPGSVNVFVTYPSGKSVNLDGSGNVSALGTVTSGTWQGSTVGVAYGGTGLTTFTGANNALYSTSASALTAGTLPVVAGGTGVTTSTGSGSVVLSTSPALVTPALGTPTSGNFSTGTFTWPTFNQNTTGTASNVTGTVAIANGGTGQTTYTDGQLLIGNSTGNTLTKTTLTAGTGVTITNGAGSITIASTASVTCATPIVAGIVYGRTEGCFFFCGNGRTALGRVAGGVNQGVNAVAIGASAGQINQGACAIAIGLSAGSSGQPASSIAIGSFTAPTGACQTHIGPIRFSCCTSGLDSMFYCGTSRELIRGTGGGGGVCCATPLVAGKVFGRTTNLCCGALTALGENTTVTGCYSVSVGYAATTSAGGGVAVGGGANVSNFNGVALGLLTTAGPCAVAIGASTSSTGPSQTHIGPIRNALGLYYLYYCPCTREITYS